jgi:hypothetical protein
VAAQTLHSSRQTLDTERAFAARFADTSPNPAARETIVVVMRRATVNLPDVGRLYFLASR